MCADWRGHPLRRFAQPVRVFRKSQHPACRARTKTAAVRRFGFAYLKLVCRRSLSLVPDPHASAAETPPEPKPDPPQGEIEGKGFIQQIFLPLINKYPCDKDKPKRFVVGANPDDETLLIDFGSCSARNRFFYA